MEQRRTRRFKLQLPVSIIRAGMNRVAYNGLTKNISSTGVLFTAGSALGTSAPIEYVIVLAHEGEQTVNLRCVGKVLRSERVSNGSTPPGPPAFQVAATLERYEFVRDN
jgi:hypothetical protein